MKDRRHTNHVTDTVATHRIRHVTPMCTLSNNGWLGSPNGISIGSAVFAALVVTHRHGPKIAKFKRGHPLRGHQMQVGWVKIGDFPQITDYISKTVKDRHNFY